MNRFIPLATLMLFACTTIDPAIRAEEERRVHRSYCRQAIEAGESPKDCEALAAGIRADLDEERSAAEAERKRREADPVGYCIKDATDEYENCSTSAEARKRDTYVRTAFQQQVVETRLQNDLQQCGARQSAELARCQNLPKPTQQAQQEQ